MLSGQHLCLLASNERISVEILRILVGGIGVVATVPITAAVAALLPARVPEEPDATSVDAHPGPAGP